MLLKEENQSHIQGHWHKYMVMSGVARALKFSIINHDEFSYNSIQRLFNKKLNKLQQATVTILFCYVIMDILNLQIHNSISSLINFYVTYPMSLYVSP